MIYLTITGLEGIGIDYRLILLIFGVLILVIIIMSLIKFLKPVEPLKIGKIKMPSMTPMIVSERAPRRNIINENILDKQNFKIESPINQDSEFEKLKDYIKTVIELGYTEREIKEVITTQGWKSLDIETAFSEIKKEDSLNKAMQYVKQNLSKGFSKFQIAYILKKSGWPEYLINNLFKEMKL